MENFRVESKRETQKFYERIIKKFCQKSSLLAEFLGGFAAKFLRQIFFTPNSLTPNCFTPNFFTPKKLFMKKNNLRQFFWCQILLRQIFYAKFFKCALEFLKVGLLRPDFVNQISVVKFWLTTFRGQVYNVKFIDSLNYS